MNQKAAQFIGHFLAYCLIASVCVGCLALFLAAMRGLLWVVLG